MKAIGFRVEPKAVHWAVVTESDTAPILIGSGKFSAPKSYDEEPKALSWYRERIRSEVQKHSPDASGVRFPETFGRKGVTSSDQIRLRIEGVILESLNSCGVFVFGGAMKSISATLGSKSAKSYVDQSELKGLRWDDYNKNCREAILVAVAAMEACK